MVPPRASHTLQSPGPLHTLHLAQEPGTEPPWRAPGCRGDPIPTARSQVGSESWNSAHTSSPRHFRGLEKSRIPLEFPEHQLFEMPLACTQPETCANRQRLELTHCWWEQTRLIPLGKHFSLQSWVLGPDNHGNEAGPKSQRHRQGLTGAPAPAERDRTAQRAQRGCTSNAEQVPSASHSGAIC